MAGLPPLARYPLPRPDELPANVASWTPDPARCALLVHDMQEYFLRPFLPSVSPGSVLVDTIARVRVRCAEAGIPVCYTAQPGSMTRAERGLLAAFWGPGMSTAAEQQQVVDELRPGPSDRVFTKWRYSAFFHSDLLAHLREQGRDQLIICGVYAQLGILMTAVESYSNDLETFVVADGVADFTAERHRSALALAAQSCAVVLTAADLLAALAPEKDPAGAAR
ncbi:MAG TPA: isochorismatase family protein [Jatrophihabitans sp.]|nr:isochorismatase family protein [Jatrophihabitans sp.]